MKNVLTRAQIQQQLKNLNCFASTLFLEHGADSRFFHEFSVLADDITDNLGPNDFAWTFQQVDAILREHGIEKDRVGRGYH